MACHGGPNISENGLVLSLDAANPRSYPGTGNTWFDISGNGNDVTLQNSPTLNSKALEFDGIDDHFRTPYIEVKSIMMTLRYDDVGPSAVWRYLVDARGGLSDGWYVPSYGTAGGGWNSVNYINGQPATITDINYGEWIVLYIEAISLFTDDINIMSRTSNNEFAGGAISNIQMYNRDLTPQEIRQNYSAFRDRFGI